MVAALVCPRRCGVGACPARSMRLIPIRPHTHFGQQRHFERCHTGHEAGDFGFEPIHFGLGHFEHQFVVDLHDHFGAPALGVEGLLHGHHAEFDEVGGGALHGGVDSGAFCASAAGAVGAVDFGQVEAAAKHGFNIALGFGLGAGVVHVLLDAGEAVEIAGDVIFGGGVVNAQGFGQAEGAHAVDEAEVDDFGVAALFAADLRGVQAEHFGGGGAVHVDTFVKGFEQGRVAAEVGHDAQLDLRVVGAGNDAARRGHEGFAHFATFGGADGDVLQVGLVAGQAPGDGHGLGVVGVDAACARVGQLGEFVGVGAFEFGQAPVLQDFGRQGVVFGEFF